MYVATDPLHLGETDLRLLLVLQIDNIPLNDQHRLGKGFQTFDADLRRIGTGRTGTGLAVVPADVLLTISAAYLDGIDGCPRGGKVVDDLAFKNGFNLFTNELEIGHNMELSYKYISMVCLAMCMTENR